LASPNGFLPLSMPDDEGVAVMSFDFNASGDGRIFLWQDGVVTTLVETAPTRSWLPANYILPNSAKDRFLIFYYREGDDPAANYTFEWLDLAHCPGPSCQLQTGSALPLWSPDEQKTVLIHTNATGAPTLGLGAADGVETAGIGLGWSPAWIDDATFAYLRPDTPLEDIEAVGDLTGTALVLVDWSETAVPLSSQVILTSDDLLDAVPSSRRPAHLLMYTLIVNPARPDQWFIQATTSLNSPTGQDYLFAYDWQSGQISSLLELGGRAQAGMQLEGNGRYLTLITSENNDPVYLIYDLENGRTVSYPFTPSFYIGADWSADGQWLLILDEEALRLIAPGSRYERPIFHEIAGCGAAVWVNSP
jgi:hypothetical protein